MYILECVLRTSRPHGVPVPQYWAQAWFLSPEFGVVVLACCVVGGFVTCIPGSPIEIYITNHV